MPIAAIPKKVDWEKSVYCAQQLHRAMGAGGLSTEDACCAFLVAYWVAVTGEIPNTEATDARAREAVGAISAYVITLVADVADGGVQ